jgi:tetratricopeptide (TPR) repeat protein
LIFAECFLFLFVFISFVTSQYAEAKKYLEKTVKLNPKDNEALYLLALVYEELRQYEKAYQTIQKLVKLDPMNNEALLKLAQLGT